MIAGRVGHNAASRFIFEQREHRVARTARLERADALEILALEIKLGVDFAVDGGAGQYRGAMHVRRDPRVGGTNRVDIGKRERIASA